MALNNVVQGFYFSVKLSGDSANTDAEFQEVSGLIASTVGNFTDNNNDPENRLPAKVKFENLVLKRGVALTDSDLIVWCQTVLGGALVSPIQLKNIVLNLNNEQGLVMESWNIVGSLPVQWKISDFTSQGNEVLIETLEFSYGYIETNVSCKN